MQNFDATNIPPQQSSGKHPEYMGPATITGTKVKPTKAGDGGIFEVTFTSPLGSIISNYNLFNKNEKAVEIAQKELSALCHATGVFKLSMPQENLDNCGMELRGARCVIDVKPQANNPEYMEVKKVFDVNGNEPGKAPNPAPQPANYAAQASQATQNGGWATQQPPAQNNASQGGGWSQGPQQGVAQQAPSGWATGGAPAQAPPWAQK